MKKILFLLAILTLGITKAQVENWKCGVDSLFHAQMSGDTAYQNRMYNYNNAVFTLNQINVVPGPIIIPVVFHVVANTPTLSYSQIQWQVARLNASFKNQTMQFMGTPSGPHAVNTQIEFRLACIAQPSVGTSWTNNSEPGVMRYTTNDVNALNQIYMDPLTISSLTNITHATAGTFPFSNYLNIWCVPNICLPPVCNQLTPTIIGYGTFPWQNSGLDGVVMRIDCIGSNTYPNNFPMFSQLDAGTVLTHEVGHYLGLYHTFETNINFTIPPGTPIGCYGTSAVTANTDGDLIYDTPPTAVTSDLGNINSINTCNENYAPYGVNPNENDQLENYMCYSDDNKLNTFTANQATRMQTAFNMISWPRYNLNTNANLIGTGVLTPSAGCLALTNILTAIFNYSLLPGANCNNIPIQFINPTSIGFSATSFTWNFGDGGTATGSNPIHTYTVGGPVYPVSCTASDGTNTVTFGLGVNTNFVSTIVNDSKTVCRGSEQTIYINFPASVPSVIITDGINQITVPNYNPSTAHQVAFTFSINGSASYSLVPAVCNGTNLGAATFSVIECCSNLVNNGDFSSGNTGFNTQLAYTLAPIVPNTGGQYIYYGTYTIQTPGTPGFITPPLTNIVNPSGPALLVDGFSNGYFGQTNGIVNITPTCTSNQKPLVWQQVLNGLLPNKTYCYSFKISENILSVCPAPNGPDRLNLETSILSAPGVFAVPVQSITPIIHGIGFNQIKYLVYTYTFVTSPTVTPSSNFTININQVKTFNGVNFDFLLDDIMLREMSAPIQAISNQTICAGNSTQLGIETNCAASAGAFNYAWTPTLGLSCSTCSNPIANPTITTVYTLVATSTVNIIPAPPAVISTVTISVIGISPTITVANSTAVCLGNSATLTASGLTNYTWFPSGLTGNSIIVTPTANTIYTVSSNDSPNCLVVKSMVAINISTLDLSFSYGLNNFCPEKTFSASATCNLYATGYVVSWNFGDGGTGSGVYTTHSYTANGQYTVTLTVAVPGTFTQSTTQTITVITNFNQPPLTVTGGPFSLCPGSSAALFASGGISGSYTWSPPPVNIDFIIITPSITTNYTLVGNNINGCLTQTTVTVVVHNEPPIVSLTPSFVCLPNNSVTLNVSGIIGDYNLYSPPMPPVVTVLSGSTILSPTVTSIYTVEATNLFGCVVTSTFQIGVVPCACLDSHGDELGGVISSSLSPNTPYKIVNNLTVGLGFVGFNNNDILIYPGVKVTVASGALLNIIASHLHGCGELWDGIEVQANGQLLVNVWGKPAKTTLIEDANVAINILDDNAPYPGGMPNYLNTLRVDRATFNKNIVGIRIGKYQRDDPNYPFTIQNCLFTSRNIPFALQSWPTTNAVKNSASGGSNMQTPYIDNATYVPTAITSTLYSYSGYPSRGIELNNVGYTLEQLVGSITTYQFKGIQIGQTNEANFNCFDNLRTDIYCYNTNLIISNSVFQTGQRFGPNNLQGGRGIVAYSDYTPNYINKNSISISYGVAGGSYSCRFYEKTGCADIFDYFNIEVQNTESYSELNNYSQLNQSNTFGGLGFNIQTNRYLNIVLQNNQLYNIKNAMMVGLNNLYNGGYLYREIGQILVLGNKVDRWLGVGGVAPYVNIGVSIADPLASANYTIPYNNNVAIANNTFTRVNNGISVMNMAYSPVGINNNTVTMVNESPTFSISPLQRGIFTAQCLKGASIGQNTVKGPSVWGQEMRALSTAMNTSLAVRCNTTSNVERGIEFNGTQTTDYFEDNWMTNETYGLVLDNSAILSAITTVIGTPVRPTNNIWDGTWTGNFKTATFGGSSAQNSKLYVLYGNPLLDPDGSGVTTGNPLADLYSHTAPLSPFTLLSSTYPYDPSCRMDNGNGGGGSGAARALLEEAVTDSINYITNQAEALHINKTAAYRSLKTNPDIMTGSNILSNFYSNAQNNYLQCMVNIEHHLSNNNVSTAQNHITALNPSNSIEWNYKNYYQLLKKNKSNTFNSNDSLTLWLIANKCPYTDGAVVYQARALYNILYKDYFYYYDNCTQQNLGGRIMKPANNKQEEPKVILKTTLFPNPNDGNYVLRFSGSMEKQSVEICIFDVVGKLVIKENRLIESGNELYLNNNLLNGTYLLKVKLQDGTIDVHRVIINK